MLSTALTWAFASSMAKSSGYMLTSANVIMVSGHGHGFSVQKNHALISVSQVRVGLSTQSYSNFGFDIRACQRRPAVPLSTGVPTWATKATNVKSPGSDAEQ